MSTPQGASTPVPTWARLIAVALAVGTLAVSVPLVSAGAFWLVSLRVTRHFQLSASLLPGQRLVISADQATLDLKPGPAGLVRVEVVDWTRVTTRSGLQPLQRDAATLSSTPDGQRLDVRLAHGNDVNLGAETDVTVEVPADTPLEVTAGTVTAHGFTGAFQVTADPGTVSLQAMNVTGSSYAHATGTLEFSGLVETANLELRSGFGGIDAVLDHRSNARIEADTSIGDITPGPGLGLAISGASISKHGSGSIGAGTGLITLRTGLGSIRIDVN
jgi:hypothetical protein